MTDIKLFDETNDYITFLKMGTLQKYLKNEFKKHFNKIIILQEGYSYYPQTLIKFDSTVEDYDKNDFVSVLSAFDYALENENYELVSEFIDLGLEFDKNKLFKKGNKELIEKVFGNKFEYSLFKIVEENLIALLESHDFIDKNYIIKNINEQNEKGQTPLMLACKLYKDLKIARILIEKYGADAKLKDNEKRDCLFYYVSNHIDLKNFEYLIEKGSDPHYPNLFSKIIKNNVFVGSLKKDWLNFLIKHKIIFSVVNIYSFDSFFTSDSKDNKECLKLLIENKIDLLNIFFNLCYYYAEYDTRYYAEDLSHCEYLNSCLDEILKSIDINSIDKDGKNALWYCKHKKILGILLEKGINKNLKDNNGETFLEKLKNIKPNLTVNCYAGISEKNKFEMIKLLEPDTKPNEIMLKVYNLTKEQLEKILKSQGFLIES